MIGAVTTNPTPLTVTSTPRFTRSRMDTVSQDKDSAEIDRAELGISGQPIVVLRNNAGDARSRKLPDPTGATEEMNLGAAPGDEAGNKSASGRSSTDDNAPVMEQRFGLGSLRVPTHLSPEHHIAFLEKQRKDKGALRIPSPREYDRGGVPEALDDGEDEICGISSGANWKRRTLPRGKSSRQEKEGDEGIGTDAPEWIQEALRVRSSGSLSASCWDKHA